MLSLILYAVKVGDMQNKKIKNLGLVLALVIIGGVMTSCKTHEVCPAYTKMEVKKNNF